MLQTWRASYRATIRPVLTYDPEAAVAHLRRADPVLARVIGSIGPFTMEQRDGSFRSLARAIFFQQLAGPAARAIMNRVLATLDSDDKRFFTPEQLLAASDEQLRSAGLSRQKLAYLRDLSEKFAGGELSEHEFAAEEDEEVIRRVISVKGVGRWTAEMFLVCCQCEAAPDRIRGCGLGSVILRGRAYYRRFSCPSRPGLTTLLR